MKEDMCERGNVRKRKRSRQDPLFHHHHHLPLLKPPHPQHISHGRPWAEAPYGGFPQELGGKVACVGGNASWGQGGTPTQLSRANPSRSDHCS